MNINKSKFKNNKGMILFLPELNQIPFKKDVGYWAYEHQTEKAQWTAQPWAFVHA